MNNTIYYATYTIKNEDIWGTAEMSRQAHGYLFRANGVALPVPVPCNDVNLQLLGRCDLTDAQHQADGDRVRQCSQTVQRMA